MASDPSRHENRLDSWKAIADYLQRDVATARRWEALGLPVRRVPGGRGRSVFAYRSEIDAWLTNTPSVTAAASGEIATSVVDRRSIAILAVLVVAGISILAWRARTAPMTPAALRVDVTPLGVVGRDMAGAERWRYPFPAEYTTVLPDFSPLMAVVSGRDPAVYVETSHRVRNADHTIESGALLSLDLSGQLRRSFSFGDEVTFAGKTYGAPWGITAFAVDDAPTSRRIALAAHHFEWDPSIVTILDGQWHRQATFVHAGWIEALHWLSHDRLLIGGYSEAHGGGMLALLDPASFDGQGPEPPGTRYYCDSCGRATGVRMVVMPRTELNRITGSRFNRAIVDVHGDRILARTLEIPSSGSEGIDALYEFTPALELVSAKFSDAYWERHRALELEGKLDHSRDRCPEKDGPTQIQIWTLESGWRTQKIH